MTVRYTPPQGVAAWDRPDPTLPSINTIPGGLEVEILEQVESGWAHIRCTNGWEAWVDGRLLVAPTPVTVAATGNALVPKPWFRQPVALVGAVLVAAVAYFALTSGGDSGDSTNNVTGGTDQAGGSAASKAAFDTVFDEKAAAAAVKRAAAVPAADIPAGYSDDVAVLAITSAMKKAGYDLGTDVFVMPVGGGNNVLYLRLDDNSPLSNASAEEDGEKLLTTLASLPEVATASVTRLAMEYHGSDQQGPVTLLFTAPLAGLLDAVRTGADPTGLIAIDITRGAP